MQNDFDINKFKNNQGVYYTKGLFIEEVLYDPISAIYSIKEYDRTLDGKFYPSLYKLYMEMEDVTEYEFATTYLDGWTHWKKLCDTSFFKPHIEAWREELTIKLKAKALANIKLKAMDPDNKDSYQASKYLVEKGWEEKKKGGVGRPTKEKIKQEAQNILNTNNDVENDFQRLFGNKGLN